LEICGDGGSLHFTLLVACIHWQPAPDKDAIDALVLFEGQLDLLEISRNLSQSMRRFNLCHFSRIVANLRALH
jgi:hypothetical protein